MPPSPPPLPVPAPTATERLLLRLEWRVLRRLEGRVAGGYRTAHRGPGIDLAGLRPYADGDDARHIDWNVTARLNEPQLRVFNEDRELTVWLVLDRSASMTVGAPGRGKQDVLSELAIVLARMFSRGGNQVGALLYDNGTLRTVPPGTGRRHVLYVAAELNRTRPGANGNGNGNRRGNGNGRGRRDRAKGGRHRGTTDLAAMLDAVAKLARRRSLIIVISTSSGTATGSARCCASARVMRSWPCASLTRPTMNCPRRASSSSRTRRPGSSSSSTPATRCCAPGCGRRSTSGTPAWPPGCAGRACPCTASTRRRTSPAHWSGS